MSHHPSLLLIAVLFTASLRAQEPTDTSGGLISSQYLTTISSKTGKLERKLDKSAEKALARLQRQEEKMRNRLWKIDSLSAKNIFGNTEEKYSQLKRKLESPGKLSNYIPHLDTISGSLNFLTQNSQLLSQVKDAKEKLKDAVSKVDAFKQQLQKADDIKKFLKERKQYLKEQLARFGFAKQLKKLNKRVYYYTQQVNEYKEVFKDPKKAEKKAIELLSKTKLFKDFMRKNSQLASLFRMPGDLSQTPSGGGGFAGLQTRAQVNNLIQQQVAAGGPNAGQQLRQNIQNAQSQLSQLKEKALKASPLGGMEGVEMPEGFKPNNQKTKSFLKRLEYGTNFQTQSAKTYFPVTSDIGLSVGYKLNDRSVIGIGTSYKLGWGTGWKNIKLTQEGAGLRSFIDWKIKGSLWISGGYEMNYRTVFNSVSELRNLNAWQQSGLLGLSKSIPIKSRFFKKTKAQLLWDFMSYQQVPRTQPLLFRVGYNLK